MIVVSNSSEYLMMSLLQGVKIVVHPQEAHPFPNGQGYMTSVGQQKGFIVTKVSACMPPVFFEIVFILKYEMEKSARGMASINCLEAD